MNADTPISKAWERYANNDYAGALICCQETLNAEPDNSQALHCAGIIYFQKHALDTALPYLEKAFFQSPDNPQIAFNYGSILFESGEYSRALGIFTAVLDMLPDHLQALIKCSVICGTIGNLSVAEKICHAILTRRPASYETYNNLGNILKEQGRIGEALQAYTKSLTINPDYPVAASNFLLCLNYSTREAGNIFHDHSRWGKTVISHRKKTPQEFPSSIRVKKDTFRIGYVSPDFRTHSVAYFFEPILKNHTRANFEIFCYSNTPLPDEVTTRLETCSDHWLSIYSMEDSIAAHRIRADAIDILIDLSGHSGLNRLPLFAGKPAPLQITYLGYPNTTGLYAIDFRITDALADPEGSDALYTEKLYRMPEGFLCYCPPRNLPSVSDLPALRNGYVTFGSFNNLAKVTDETIALWSNILSYLPDAHLVLKAKPFNDQAIVASFTKRFALHGITETRLALIGYSPSLENHFSHYNNIDISLDTFPYNGTTTTCEALVMGVPVITSAGQSHAGRVGVSLLTRIGMEEYISENSDCYISKAVALARDTGALAGIRKNLRNKVLGSPLCDGVGFTRKFEEALVKMWETK